MMSSTASSARERWELLRDLAEAEGNWQASRWDWCALLRLIQCAYPELPCLGRSLGPDQDPVRLAQPAFFHPPATTVAGLRRRGPRERPVGGAAGGAAPAPPDVPWLYSYHVGLFGPFGALPLHLTEFADRQHRAGDPAFWAFCNTLTHRFLCFFFRAWADGRKELALDRAGAAAPGPLGRPGSHESAFGHSFAWATVLADLIGCGLESQRDLDELPFHAKLFYAGRLLEPARNAEGLRAILEDYFAVPVLLSEFQPRTLPIPEFARWTLGAKERFGHLGCATLVGAAVVDSQSGFRLRFGPLSLPQFESFLPPTDGFRQIHDWIRLYCGAETDPDPESGLESAWDLQLVLRGPEVPPLTLGGDTRLGWTTWLYSAAPAHEVDDLVIRPRQGFSLDETVRDAASVVACPP